MTIIDRRLADTPAQLRDDVQHLIDRATTVAAANEIVYTGVDLDVVPPRQLTTQMPVTGPIGVPPNRVGWLEMIIGRDGSVENGQAPHAAQSTPRAHDREPRQGVAVSSRHQGWSTGTLSHHGQGQSAGVGDGVLIIGSWLRL